MTHATRPHPALRDPERLHRRSPRGLSRLAAVLATASIALAGCSEIAADLSSALDEPAVSESAGQDAADAGGQDTEGGAGTGDSDAPRQLAELTVAPEGPMTGYSRERFPHWSSHGDNCNTREVVLERDGTDVVADDQCRPQSGTWISVYDDQEFTEAGDLDIDHTVPLAAAWRSGAADWDEDRREAFANDLDSPQLLAVSASSNRSKGDQTPADWLPPAESYHCVYAEDWIAVKHLYELTVTEDEAAALEGMLATC
ncbi:MULTISPECIES: HNH endonuclease family protein [Actinoalloteichus]|uniref:DUF1524 family protein n=1 Tax=Actinoalloteichus fjordicus TaxID=1612552 RepID=A0AAC9LB47_9PSEU|nr:MULTISPECIES: HNH endonuclease family protein [Actinoalloteichus]APU14352.1 putative DUF1524 family protein [Actinoalloteichus fjordicus]APU20321.1 putative DUF1524 family protein [Actinoalloteichus sp. GBA129-24]